MTQPRSSSGSPTVAISQSTMAASRAGAAVAVHDVGELVVAVHDARAGSVRGRWARSHVGRLVDARGCGRNCTAARWAQPPVDLALVEPVGTAEPLEAPGLPVDPGQPGDPVDQLEGQAPPGLEVGVEGRRPASSPSWIGDQPSTNSIR